MPATRLTAQDWIGEGLRLLSDGGLPALKVDALCARLGVTKGSFYWHFDDLSAFEGALRDEWTQTRLAQRAAFQTAASSPRALLDAMFELAIEDHEMELERAMREWARTDARVRAQVAEWDAWVMAELRAAFAELGFEGDQREMRASVLFLAGVGFVHVGRARGTQFAAQRAALLDLVSSPRPREPGR